MKSSAGYCTAAPVFTLLLQLHVIFISAHRREICRIVCAQIFENHNPLNGYHASIEALLPGVE